MLKIIGATLITYEAYTWIAIQTMPTTTQLTALFWLGALLLTTGYIQDRKTP